MDLTDTIEKGVPSGRVTTLEEYFAKNTQSVHVLNGDPMRKGVMLNGAMIEVGSNTWKNICQMPIYHDVLLGEIRLLYHNHNNK